MDSKKTSLIEGLTSGIQDNKIRKFTNKILFENKKEFFKIPSSVEFHHTYKGGNFDHTKNVMKIVQNGCDFYKVNSSIAIAGAVLHDIGKIYCYRMLKNRAIAKINNVQRAHFILGNKLLEDSFKKYPIISQFQFDEIQHILLSHHGMVSNGFGSIVDPYPPEALLVHQADTMDAYLSHSLENNKF